MTNYLHQLLVASRVPAFSRPGSKYLHKKSRAHHQGFQAEIKSRLSPDSPPPILNGPVWIWMKQTSVH